MNFPSTEFDDAVAAACHGTGSDADVTALHAILQTHLEARDAYLWQVELHSFLASRANARFLDGDLAPKTDVVPLGDARTRPIVRWMLATVAVTLAFAVGLFWPDRMTPEPNAKGIADHPDLPRLIVVEESEPSADLPDESPGFAAQGIIRDTVRFASASDAPILVATGGLEPLELGADVPYDSRADTLHVWNWSQSTRSQVWPEVRAWVEQRFCLSPDGTWLVWRHGDVLNLVTGERSKIDLGGDFHLGRRGDSLVRIEHLQFTPDGQRLALLLDEVELTKSDHPLRKNDLTTTPVFQIVEFPAGTLISQFPAGVPADLPLAFSADGKRVASQYPREKSGVRIVERDVSTGTVRREYESQLSEFVSAIGWSPDGSLLAVVGISGEALVWDTESGQLRHQVPLGQSTSSVHLCFSPDGKFLAISLFPGFNAKLVVIDVATGKIVATLKQETSGSIHWAADSQSFDVLYDHRGILEAKDKAGRHVMYNRFPEVKTFKMEEIRGKG
jgi:hypothetical protein